MEQKTVYNISYYVGDYFIDATQIDELDEELIWELYEEFGYIKKAKARFEVEAVFEG